MIQWVDKSVLNWCSIWLYPYSCLDNKVYNAKRRYLWKKHPKCGLNKRMIGTNKLFGDW